MRDKWSASTSDAIEPRPGNRAKMAFRRKLYLDSVMCKGDFSPTMSLGGAPPKRTNKQRRGISNTEIVCALAVAYTEDLGLKKRGRTVETGAVLFLHYMKATPDC